jgi:hypothetical protein
MSVIWFRFYGELNDFVRPERHGRRFLHRVRGSSSVKDTIEALDVPHPEVDVIIANGMAVDFTYPLRDGDRVAVYPAFRSVDLGELLRVGQPLPDPVQFVLDIHLRKLASLLRLAGFDAVVLEGDAEIARMGGRDGRVVLTRDRELLERNEVRWGYWVRSTDPPRQFLELVGDPSSGADGTAMSALCLSPAVLTMLTPRHATGYSWPRLASIWSCVLSRASWPNALLRSQMLSRRSARASDASIPSFLR